MRKATHTPAWSGLLARRTGYAWILLLVAVASSTGCRRGQARALPEIPLDVPAPPPRVVEVNDPQVPPIISLPEAPVRTTPPTPPRTPPPRLDARPPEPRPEAPETRPPDDATRSTPPPAPTLQTTPAQQEGEAERKIRLLLSQATNDLNRINVQHLNADARQQFDTARRFVAQTEEALRSRNLVFASTMADKAAALASQLSGR